MIKRENLLQKNQKVNLYAQINLIKKLKVRILKPLKNAEDNLKNAEEDQDILTEAENHVAQEDMI